MPDGKWCSACGIVGKEFFSSESELALEEEGDGVAAIVAEGVAASAEKLVEDSGDEVGGGAVAMAGEEGVEGAAHPTET
jgi:hypothetical protein